MNNNNIKRFVITGNKMTYYKVNNKKRDCIVYIIQYDNGKKYALKINIKKKCTVAEMNIYKELAEYQKRDILIANKIVKLCSSGIICDVCDEFEILLDSENFIKINIGKENNMYVDILNMMMNSKHKLLYVVTEIDSGYVKLSTVLHNISSITLGTIVTETINLLRHLNTICGFIHWDLWDDNILVKISADNKIDIKLYDFDQSSTIKNSNNEFLARVDNAKNTGGKYTTIYNNQLDNLMYGLCYDIIRFISSIYIDSNRKKIYSNNDPIRKFFGILYTIFDQNKLLDSSDYFTFIINYANHTVNKFKHNNESFKFFITHYFNTFNEM